MVRFSMQPRVAAAAAFAALLLAAHPALAQVIPASRVFTNAWRSAGYPGEIPAPDTIVNVLDFGAAGDGSTDDYAAVAAAISSLGGAPGVVYFPAGTYLLGTKVNVPAGTVLRGQRPSNTTLRFNVIYHCISVAKNESGAFQAVVSGYTAHSRAITVTDGGAFAVGDYVEIREDNDPAWNASDWAPKVAAQILRVSGVAGNTLTFENPLRLTYQAAQNPEIRKITPIENAGVENLKVERLLAGTEAQRNNQFTIQFRYAANCWARGVQSDMGFGGHIGIEYSTKVDVTGCYFNDAHEHDGGGSGYGVRLEFTTGECLIEDNIFKHLRHSMLVQAGVNGNVFGYNYSREPDRTEWPAELSSDITLHGNYPYANLYEGNICQHIWMDASHGANGPLNTFFRNRAEDYGFNMTDSLANNQNVVGNETFKGGWAVFVGDGYSLKGSGHFEYGNNTEADGIEPDGTEDLTDFSYYLGTSPTQAPPTPAFWDIPDAIPTIGVPKTLSPAKNNPAYVRYFGGGVKTVGPPSLARQPTNVTVDAGSPAAFSVEAYGTPVAEYQWRKGGSPIAGATNATLTLSDPQVADAGTYDVVVSDPDGSVTSAGATLAVNAVNVELVTAGTPAPYGSPTPFGYGTNSLAPGTVVTNAVATPVGTGPGTRQACTGWSGAGSVSGSGGTNTVTVTVSDNSELTWEWAAEYELDLAVSGNGSLDRSSAWFRSGSNVVVTAQPTYGHLFSFWSGDVPAPQTNSPQITLAMTQPRSATAHFARIPKPDGTVMRVR